MSGCAIDLDRLSSAYGTTRVCDEISLRIRRGAKVVLVGSNGAGKSSLLNILAGKRRPVGGSALVLGEDAFECTTLVQRIALVTSEWMECVPGTNLPVKTLVASAAVGVAPERVAELVEVLGAHALLRSHVNSLSEGQRRCVHLLCKLLPPRELLLFDEATSSLDVVTLTLTLALTLTLTLALTRTRTLTRALTLTLTRCGAAGCCAGWRARAASAA